MQQRHHDGIVNIANPGLPDEGEIMSSPANFDRRRVLKSAAETARWLDRNHGKAEDVADALAAWCAITAAGLLLPDGKPRRLFGEAGLARTLGELVGNDGGVLARSPLGQMEAITLLTDLAACYRATRRDPPQAIDGMQALLVPPLLALTHGDGGLGNWQGAGAVSADRIASLVQAYEAGMDATRRANIAKRAQRAQVSAD